MRDEYNDAGGQAQYANHLTELSAPELVGEHAFARVGALEALNVRDQAAWEFWLPRHTLCDHAISRRDCWNLVEGE